MKRIRSVRHERANGRWWQTLQPRQKAQRDKERESEDFTAKPLDQTPSRVGGASRRKDIVDDEHTRMPSPITRVGVNFETVSPVLERIFDDFRLRRQLAALSHRNE